MAELGALHKIPEKIDQSRSSGLILPQLNILDWHYGETQISENPDPIDVLRWLRRQIGDFVEIIGDYAKPDTIWKYYSVLFEPDFVYTGKMLTGHIEVVNGRIQFNDGVQAFQTPSSAQIFRSTLPIQRCLRRAEPLIFPKKN